jgi:Tfp pilus assembly protein PilV
VRTLPMMKPAGKGFSLVEVLLASGILVVGVVPLFFLFQSSLGRAHLSREEFAATLLASETMDQIRLVPLASMHTGSTLKLNLSAGVAAPNAFADKHNRVPLELGTYPVNLSMSVSVTTVTSMAQVTVDVSWGKKVAPQEHFVLTEFVEDRKPHPAL